MNAGEEWVGGMLLMPPAQDDPAPLALLLWVQPVTGMVLGLTVRRVTELAERAAESLLETTRDPKDDRGPRTPATLRVQTAGLMDLLRDRVGNIELVLAPTPELAPVVEALRDQFGDLVDPSSLSLEVIEHFIVSAGELRRLAPWDHVPGDGYFRVRCPHMRIEEGAIAILGGPTGETYCLALFRTEDDAVDCLIALDEAEDDGPAALPQHIVVEWGDPKEPAIASMMLTDLSTRPLVEGELAGVTAVLRSLAMWIQDDPEDLESAWDADELSVTRSTRVDGPGGTIDVDLSAPLWLEDDDLDVDEREAVRSLLAAGTAAGFDMSTEAGIRAYLAATVPKPKKPAKVKTKAKAKAKAKAKSQKAARKRSKR